MKIFLLLLLITTAQSIRIGCRYTYYTFQGTIVDMFPTCNVISMDFSDHPTRVTFANGTAAQIRETKMVYFGWRTFVPCGVFNLTFVPEGMSTVFPNLIGLM